MISLKKNFAYKVLALGVALVIWAYANDGRNPTVSREIKVSLEMRRLDPGFVVTSAPQTISVLVEGSRNHIQSIAGDPESVTAFVNLHESDVGRRMCPVVVRLPDGYAGLVNAVPLPRDVPVVLAKKAERTLAVDVQFSGSPPVGYRYGTPQASPARVKVIGTADSVKQVDKLIVTLDAEAPGPDGISGNFRVTPIDKNGKTVQDVELSPEQVQVKMELLEAPAHRAVFVSVDTVGQPPFPYRIVGIDVYPQTVTISGRPERLVNITSLKTEPIQLSERDETFTEQAEIMPRAGITLPDENSVRVTVRIEKSPDQHNNE